MTTFARLLAVATVALAAVPDSRAADPPNAAELKGDLKKLYDTLQRLPEVYRVQLEVKTSQSNAGETKDMVLVRLSDTVSTWLDHSGNDRHRPGPDMYDLMQTDDHGKNLIRKLDDIAYVELEKPGTDDWYVDWFRLLVNGQVVYEKTFSQPLRIGDDKGSVRTFRVAADELRKAQGWKEFKKTIPGLTVTADRVGIVIPRGELEARLEGIVGHFLHAKQKDYQIAWHDENKRDGVAVRRLSDDAVRVELKLRVRKNNLPDPNVKVSFDVRFKPTDGKFAVEVSNQKVDVKPGVLGTAVLFINNVFGGQGEKDLERAAEKYLARQLRLPDLPIDLKGLPVYVIVNERGDLEVGFGGAPARKK